MNWKVGVFLLSLTGLVLQGCGTEEAQSGPGISVEGPWARAMPVLQPEGGPGTNSALYLNIRNDGRGEDRLLGGSTPAATAVEVHESYLEGEVMRMRRVDALALPPSSTTELKPGGLHIMLIDLVHPLMEGDSLALTLRFETSGSLELSVPVRGSGGQ